MFKAWSANKLGRALGKAGLYDKALQHAVAESEDALTSSVLGRMSYLPGHLAWKVFEDARPARLGASPWPSCPDEPPDWQFWPHYDMPQHWHGQYVEPDVVVEWGPWLLVIEVKHRTNHHLDQWLKEVLAVAQDASVGVDRVLFLALGGKPEADKPLARCVLEPYPKAMLFSLQWHQVYGALQRLAARPDLEPGTRSMVGDAAVALAASGNYVQRGMQSLVEGAVSLRPRHDPTLLHLWRITHD